MKRVTSSGTTIATICARGGSKGLPRKNILPFAGKPLIAHTISSALACPLIDAVFVSTDDENIANVARSYGAQVPVMRPPELATDSAAKIPVIEHLVKHLESIGHHIERVVDLQPTSPLRTQADLVAAINLSTNCDLVVSVTEPSHNPYFSLAELQPDGTLSLSKTANFVTMQAAPAVFGLNGSIYVWRRTALASAALHGFWSTRMIPYVMTRSRSVDIDGAEDFELAEWYFAKLHGLPT
jgi:CMP-N,N'-diacetyllegionaminic acid synthase